MRKVWYLFLALCVVGFAPVFAQSDDEPISMVDGKPDTDGDGIPDEWEKQYGLNPNNMFDGKMDMDGDKIKNIDEYKLKTNPTDKDVDKNKDGVADDWMKFNGFTDANADADGDSVSNKEEYEAGTNPKDANSSPKKVATVSQKHPEPSMDGVKENIDANIPDNHLIKPNVLKFLDPIGDDRGPGYYTYPTNPVYANGGFDIVSFEVDASGADTVTFKITINANVKQDWGMAADFDVQHFQIYIDQDKVPGSGNVKSIPGLNIYFDPANAWEKAVIITPQPTSRVEIELAVKAADMREEIVIPSKISASGQTIVAVVSKKELGFTEDTDISKWGWQLIAQSNEGYPDPEDVLTRNVNEYRGLHRFGGGNDYWGDPEVMDILVWPAKGTLQEAKDQFSILNVWESYPDPKLDIRAVVPLISMDQSAQWAPSGGYSVFAKDLAAKIKPPAQKDKYVSDNFSMSVKVFTRYNWNLNPSFENFMKNSLEVQFFGKAFTDKVGFYMRWEIGKWDNTVWTLWANDTPAQQSIVLQSFRAELVKPLPTIDVVSIGNYELDYSPWVMGAPWYPDRDKLKGIFIDGSVESYFDYHFTIHYPLQWIGLDWGHGNTTYADFAYGLKLNTTYIRGLKLSVVGAYYSDFETSPLTSTNLDPKKLVLRGYNAAVVVDASYKMALPFANISIGGICSLTSFGLGQDFINLERGLEQDIDGNGEYGALSDKAEITPKYGTNGMAAVGTVKIENLFGPLNIVGQGFYISSGYTAIGSARGDTSPLASGFGGSPTADILLMNGNQSVHRAPQAADFVSSVAIPGLPAEFIISDPVTSIKTIGWINDNWEGVAATGWQGFTAIASYFGDILRVSGEFSYVGYNNMAYSNITQLRGYLSAEYSLIAINGKVTLFGKFMTINNENQLNWMKYPMMIVPGISYAQQLTKFVNASLTYKMEYGAYSESGTHPLVNTNTLIFVRHRIGLNLNIALPVGYIHLVGEYWMEPKIPEVGFSGRTPYGAYAITEWEFAF